MAHIKKERYFFTVYGQKNSKNQNFNTAMESTKDIYL